MLFKYSNFKSELHTNYAYISNFGGNIGVEPIYLFVAVHIS